MIRPISTQTCSSLQLSQLYSTRILLKSFCAEVWVANMPASSAVSDPQLDKSNLESVQLREWLNYVVNGR